MLLALTEPDLAERAVRCAATRLCLLLMAAGAASGCESPEPADAPTDADSGATGQEAGLPEVGLPDAYLPDVADGDAEGGPDSAAAVGCAAAQDITSIGVAEGHVDPPAGQAGYFKFTATAGEFFRIDMRYTNPHLNILASAFSLYSGDGTTLLASKAETFPLFLQTTPYGRGSLAYRSLEDAVFCGKVEAWSMWAGAPTQGKRPYSYSLSAQSYSVLDAAYDADQEPNDDLSSAQPVRHLMATDFVKTQAYDIIGSLEGASDVDVYRVPIPAGSPWGYAQFLPPGPGGPGLEGSGSTLQLGTMELTNLDGNTLALADAAQDHAHWLSWTSPEEGQEVLLWVRRAPGSVPGANDFYRVKFFVRSSNDDYLESETVAGDNDSTATAAPAFSWLHDTAIETELVGNIHPTAPGAPVDVDYWSVGLLGASNVQVWCRSRRAGSGVVDAQFSILDEQGNELRSGVEPRDRDFLWSDRPGALGPPLSVPTTGTYFLRITAAGQVPEVASRHYECDLWNDVP